MKKRFKILATIAATAAIATLGVFATGCGDTSDWLKDKMDQLTCTHEYDDGVETKAATCSEYGELIKTCSICFYEKTEKIDKLPHTEVITEAVAATCTENGKTEGVSCSVCDEVIVKQQTVKALGHKIVELEAVEPTCLTAGKTAGEYCERCEETVVAQKHISALGHKVVTVRGKAATCTESGLTDGQACGRCDTVYVAQEVIPAKGHNYVDGVCTTCAADEPVDLAVFHEKYMAKDLDGYTVTELSENDIKGTSPYGNYYVFTLDFAGFSSTSSGFHINFDNFEIVKDNSYSSQVPQESFGFYIYFNTDDNKITVDVQSAVLPDDTPGWSGIDTNAHIYVSVDDASIEEGPSGYVYVYLYMDGPAYIKYLNDGFHGELTADSKFVSATGATKIERIEVA